MRNLLNELSDVMDIGDDIGYDIGYDIGDDEARDKITDMVSDTVNYKVSDKPINRLTSYITYFPKRLRSDIIYRHRLSGYYLSHN